MKRKIFHHLLEHTNNISSTLWMCKLFPEIIDEKNKEGLTAVHIVVILNKIEALQILLEFQPNLELADNEGHTALHFAVGKQRKTQPL